MAALRKTALALVAVVVAGAWFSLALRDESPGERVTLAARAPHAIQASAAPAAAEPSVRPALAGARPAAPMAPASPSAKLRADFLRARDWRVFALDAMQRPAEGGHYYARYVIDLCGMRMAELKQLARETQAKQLAGTGTIDGAQQKAAEAVFSRCDSFLPDETASLFAELRRREREGLDPLVAAERDAVAVFRAADPAALRSLAERLFSLADPLLMSRTDLLRGLASRGPAAVARQGIVFDGEVVTPEQAVAHDNAAWALRLGACMENAPCSRDDMQVLACAVAGRCYADRRAYLEAELAEAGRQPEDAATILAMADQVRQAVAAGNVAFFVR